MPAQRLRRVLRAPYDARIASAALAALLAPAVRARAGAAARAWAARAAEHDMPTRAAELIEAHVRSLHGPQG